MQIPPEIEAVALLGWRVYPASRSGRQARFKGAADAATANLDTIAGWCDSFPASNWRVVMMGSGIWALDVDAPGPDHAADGIRAMRDLVAVHGALPPRPMTRSGGGGYAMFFKHAGEPIYGKTGWPAPGIDPRRGKLSVTIPPSLHLTTRAPYRWLTPPWAVNPPVAPAWLLTAVAPPALPPPRPFQRAPSTFLAKETLIRALHEIGVAVEGTRNDTLNRASYRVGRYVAAHLMGAGEAEDQLTQAAQQAGLDRREIIGTIKSAFDSAKANPVEVK